MLDAGVPIDKALKTLSRSNLHNRNFRRALDHVQKGVSLPESLHRYGFLNQFDFQLLSTANQAGKLPSALAVLGQQRTDRLTRIRALKAALWLPNAVLLIGALAALFIRTMSFHQPLTMALVKVTIPLLITLALNQILFKVLSTDSRHWLSLFWPLGAVRRFSEWFKLSFEQTFYRSLLWLIEAGVNFSQAVNHCEKLLRSNSYSVAVTEAAAQLDSGGALSTTLNQNGLVLSKSMLAVLSVGETSGTLAKSLQHELKIQQNRFALKIKNFDAWLPRLYYVVILLVVVRIMVSG